MLGASVLAVGGTAATTLFTQSAGAVGCSAAGSTGLTAAQVATTNQTISASVDATGCDIGIYVPPGATGVTIGGATSSDGITVSGANDTGIFVDQTTGTTIENDTVQNNGVAPGAGIGSFGGIVLAGVSNATVSSNTVTGNGGGGIIVNDNGPVNPVRRIQDRAHRCRPTMTPSATTRSRATTARAALCTRPTTPAGASPVG